jgi:peptide-methionine (S)-S-oxide reductase
VVRTRVGYAGGTKRNPTYRNLDGHAETIQIDYDPTQISYAELLDVFWESHDPTRRTWSRQYMSAIFYHDRDQKWLALETRARQTTRSKERVYTEVSPFPEFYRAEAYHQKYRLRQEKTLMKEFRTMYPDVNRFVDSTAVARVNGYLGGHGTLMDFKAELNSLGLSAAGAKRLKDIVQRTLK